MESNQDGHEAQLMEILSAYREAVLKELQARWDGWPLDPSRNEVHEVAGALLARQATLTVELASGPPMWTPHIAPLVIRAMLDLRISFEWILRKPAERSRLFIRYGLGQAKLLMEHAKATRAESDDNDSAEDDPWIKGVQRWIDGQRYHFLTEVNVGNWADSDLREMARECGREQLYRSYTSFSAATHNMWHHVQVYNLRPCSNPLHRGGHRVPHAPTMPSDITYLKSAAEYLRDTFDVFDRFSGVTPTCASAYELLETRLVQLGDQIAAETEAHTEKPEEGVSSDGTEAAPRPVAEKTKE